MNSEIRFLASSRDKTLTTVDNGRGMSPAQLEHYHDIAATTKVRGKGIGFAGVGAKLALLVAKEVITETRGELGWLLENTVWINRGHPAYQKAVAGGHEQYHVVLTVAWVLLGHLDDRHSAQQFIGEFLFGWGARR